MEAVLDHAALAGQNQRFHASGGRSEDNRGSGFRPAFLDAVTRVVYRSCFADGSPAPFHLLDGLPGEVVVDRDPRGRVLGVKGTVIAGFVRDGRFYTREEAALAQAG